MNVLPGCNALQAGVEPGALILAPRSEAFVDALLSHTGLDEGVALQVQKLADIGFGHPRIADQHSPAPPVRIGSGASSNLCEDIRNGSSCGDHRTGHRQRPSPGNRSFSLQPEVRPALRDASSEPATRAGSDASSGRSHGLDSSLNNVSPFISIVSRKRR